MSQRQQTFSESPLYPGDMSQPGRGAEGGIRSDEYEAGSWATATSEPADTDSGFLDMPVKGALWTVCSSRVIAATKHSVELLIWVLACQRGDQFMAPPALRRNKLDLCRDSAGTTPGHITPVDVKSFLH